MKTLNAFCFVAVLTGLLGARSALAQPAMAKKIATPASEITVLPGFKVELIHSAQAGEGSWVAMTIDPKGRLIISPQNGEPLVRVTLTPEGQIQEMEKIDLPVTSAMGLLYAFDSLYVSGKGPDGLGLYRLRDTKNTDHYDKWELLRDFDKSGAGEHGSHALVLGPDNMIYHVNGNFVKVPKDIAPTSQHRNYAEDQLLPRGPDGNGFGNNNPPPGGFVLRMDRDAKNVELFASGFRNTYDIAFNAQGELFGFDSDMEWDWGMPWYRPIRINHIVNGGDYGFREGTGKWPEYFPDSLPANLNIGIGSPTGVKFGTGAKYPAKYQRAFFVMDWSYGRFFAVHTTPKGSTYSATAEVFLQGKPLNLTDFEFGHDGAMYFLTGGRNTQTGLYRVSYVGNESTKAVGPEDTASAAKARALRHQLEAFHGREDSNAVKVAWPYLNSDDRWIRFAARIAVEAQPVASWQSLALNETRTEASLTALLALARYGDKSLEGEVLKRLERLSFGGLSPAQKLELLRIYSVAFIRMGRPAPELAAPVIKQLDPHFPGNDLTVNRELARMLLYLDAPYVIPKTLALIKYAPTQEDQIFYLFNLRTIKNGWTPKDHLEYLSWFRGERSKVHPLETLQWFADAGRGYSDGASFPNFVSYFRRDALESLTESERTSFGSLADPEPAPAPKKPRAAAPRKLVQEWKMQDLEPLLDRVGTGRSYDRGKEIYAAAQCATCHRFGTEGGAVGPELTAVSSRFKRRDILESIIEPSKVLSEQYQNIIFSMKDGEDVTGRILEDKNDVLTVQTNPITLTNVSVAKANITKRTPSKISPMPEGLVNIFKKEEILDLIAYLESGGNKDHADFKRASK